PLAGAAASRVLRGLARGTGILPARLALVPLRRERHDGRRRDFLGRLLFLVLARGDWPAAEVGPPHAAAARADRASRLDGSGMGAGAPPHRLPLVLPRPFAARLPRADPGL